MKINKFLFVILLIIMMLINVKADEIPVEIKSILLESKSEMAIIKSEPSFSGIEMNFDIQFSEVNDYVKYKVIIMNSGDKEYKIKYDSFKFDNENIEYSIEGDEILAPLSENIFYITIRYKKEILESDYIYEKYNIKKKSILEIEDNNISENNIKPTIDDTSDEEEIVNPKTGNNAKFRLIIFTILIILATILIVIIKYKQPSILIILLFVPFVINAIEEIELTINTNIVISKYNDCYYEGELVKGVSYTYGQYTYHYMQEYIGNGNWQDMNLDGWGIMLTDQESTEPVTSKTCSYINEKPIVSMFATFYQCKAPSIDLTYFDTKNVVNMRSAFIYAKSTELIGLDKIDTSKVTNMPSLFRDSHFKELDLSNFDTSNVTSMFSMFQSAAVTSLDLSSFDTSKVTDMQQMFHGSKITELDISNFDMTNIKNVKSIFRESNIKKVYVNNESALNMLKNSSFKPKDLIVEIKQ